MGYETTIFVCQTYKAPNRPDYLGIIAALDMSCLGSQSKFYKHYSSKTTLIKSFSNYKAGKYKTPFQFDPCTLAWHGKQEKYINEDTYGDPLVAIPAKKALELLKQDFEESKGPLEWPKVGYRRLHAAVALLEVLVKRFSDLDLVVVPWGH